MPAPGPGGKFIDSFQGNKLNSKWIVDRISSGGQNNGVYVIQVKDGKLYLAATSGGTESDWWGARLRLPLNVAAGQDVIVEGEMRQKATVAIQSLMGVGFNQPLQVATDNGLEANYSGGVLNYTFGRRASTKTLWPGFPGTNQVNLPIDNIFPFRLVRQNSYLKIYIAGFYVYGGSFAGAITSLDLTAGWYQAVTFNSEKWYNWISVSPREVVQ